VRAIDALLAATRQAATRHDHASVLRHADTGIALGPASDLRAELMVRRAVARHAQGLADENELLAAYEAALAAGRIEDAVHTAYLLGEWAGYVASDAAAIDSYTEIAYRLAVTQTPGNVTALPAYTMAYRLVTQGRYVEAIALADEEIARARRAGAETAAALLLVWRGSARIELGDVDGVEEVREALAILSARAHPKSAVTASNLGHLYAAIGRLDDARAVFEQGRAWALRTGNAFADRICACGLARIVYYAGGRDEAGSLLQGLVAANSFDRSLEEIEHGYLALRQHPKESLADARRALAYAESTGHVDMRLSALVLAARAAHASGDRETTDAMLDGCVAWSREIGSRLMGGWSIAELAIVLAARDRHAELADLTRRVVDSAWRDAARALAERRYADASAIFADVPCLALRDAADELARQQV
jgi:tetratricopeptide (TPR) repeat protein